jgi:uroporphyrinogen decarboxylase
VHEERVVPRILFTKGGGHWLEDMAQSGADALGIDWQTPLGLARRRVGATRALQGNLDPTSFSRRPRRSAPKSSASSTRYGYGPGHVFNLGHGISQHTPPEHVQALVEAVHTRLSRGPRALNRVKKFIFRM